MSQQSNNQKFRIKSIFDGSFLTRKRILKQLPFMLYVSLLFIIYIANAYFGEKTMYEIEKTRKELIELRNKYITVKSRLMINTNLSQVSKKLEPLGLKPAHVPPNKIFVKRNNE